jgi:dihydrofolate synthase/folylpolyglutamate synthase
MDATLAREGDEFGVLRRSLAVGGQELTLQGLGGVYERVLLPLHGAHQAQNAAVALAAVEAFLGAGPKRQLDADAVREGFGSVTVPGRLERVRSSPSVLLDAAHNPAGMAATVAALVEEFSFRRLVGVVAFLADKDASGMLEQLEPVLDAVVVTRNSSSRGMSVDDLAPLARQVFGDERVTVAPDLLEAVDAAVTLAEADGETTIGGVGVLVTGSVITVADARRMFLR